MRKIKRKLFYVLVVPIVLILSVGVANSADFGAMNPNMGSGGYGYSTGNDIQMQNAQLEAGRMMQIRSALMQDYWTKYRLYIDSLNASFTPAGSVATYPLWERDIEKLIDNYLEDIKSAFPTIFGNIGQDTNEVYSLEWIAPVASDPLPASGRIRIVRKRIDKNTAELIRGILPAITVDIDGLELSMVVNPPEAFLGQEALSRTLVRNNGLPLDPQVVNMGQSDREVASATTAPTGGRGNVSGGTDATFLPGTWVTFASKGTNVGTAQQRGDSVGTVYRPTINFKDKDGEIRGVATLKMWSQPTAGGLSDPMSDADAPAKILFVLGGKGAATGSNANSNLSDGDNIEFANYGSYIRFRQGDGEISGTKRMLFRDPSSNAVITDNSDPRKDMWIWANMQAGGDIVMLNVGDNMDGISASANSQIKFGRGDFARIYLDDANKLRMEGNNWITLQAPNITLDGETDITKNLHVAGYITVGGTIVPAPDPGFDGQGDLTVYGNLNVKKNTLLEGTLDVHKNATFGRTGNNVNVKIYGNLDVTQKITANNADINGTIISTKNYTSPNGGTYPNARVVDADIFTGAAEYLTDGEGGRINWDGIKKWVKKNAPGAKMLAICQTVSSPGPSGSAIHGRPRLKPSVTYIDIDATRIWDDKVAVWAENGTTPIGFVKTNHCCGWSISSAGGGKIVINAVHFCDHGGYVNETWYESNPIHVDAVVGYIPMEWVQ